MPLEIERKFLVIGEAWRSAVSGSRPLRQGYLARTARGTIRVRRGPDSGRITVKSKRSGISRTEFDYAIPAADADHMLRELCRQPILEKVRYDLQFGGLSWQVDVFGGAGEGLVLAEVELETSDQTLELPPWVGAEVTRHPLFRSSAIATGQWRRAAILVQSMRGLDERTSQVRPMASAD